MHTRNLSRRSFSALAGSSLLAPASLFGDAGPLTANQVVDRIKKQVGVEWRAKTVDTFKAGNPDARVTGIATTVMSTLDLLQRAAAAKKNLVITHEPTFYNGDDNTEGMESDPVYQFKQDFIKKHDMVVWRFHDHWHARRPDGMLLGLAKAAGWDRYQDGENQRRYILPETTLENLAKSVQSKLQVKTMRVIGDPKTKVSRLGMAVGSFTMRGVMRTLQDTDVLVVGEVREWEGVEYTHDAVAAGNKKGLIILGHAISEDPGMKECADWLKTFISEVPIEFIPGGEPFWKPK